MQDMADGFELIENLPFATESTIGRLARIGLVVLSSDFTIEHEFRALLGRPGVDVFHARIPNAPRITPESLAAMGPLITDTVDLLPPELDVVAYGCTSASMVLGPDAVAGMIHAARPGVKATNPAAAAYRALSALGAERVAVLTPYRRDVNEIVHRAITGAGFEVPVFGSFNEENDPVVAAIDTASIVSAVRRLVEGRAVDAVFVSCTAVRIAHAIAEVEAEVGLPVTSSNHALAWHCLRLAGVEEPAQGMGRLFEL